MRELFTFSQCEVNLFTNGYMLLYKGMGSERVVIERANWSDGVSRHGRALMKRRMSVSKPVRSEQQFARWFCE